MKDRIIQAQRQILDDLVACESMIGDLYEIYATMHPQSSSLWSALTTEERSHSAMLASLHKLLDAGHLFWDIGHFRHETIADEIAFVRTALDQARMGKRSESECIETAIRIEVSLLDSKFYSIVKSEAKEFAQICEALSRATEGHVQNLKDELVQQKSPGVSLGPCA